MSLEYIADHLAAKGRGPDDTLVHMSRDEVKSLSELAMANGGQLTINPQTGLPEAGFLSAILPMVAGAALGPAGLGLTAMQAGLAVGAGSYLMNPRGGIMGALSSGLGGYGGAGLGAGLESLGSSEAGATTANAATTAAEEGAKQEMARQQAQLQAQKLAESKYIDPNFLDVGSSANEFTRASSALPTSTGGIDVGAAGSSAADQLATIKSNIANEYMAANPVPTGFDAMQQGAKSLITDPTAEKFKTLGGGSYSGLAKTGLAAAAPAFNQQAKLNMPATTNQKQQVVPHYRFNPGMVNPTPRASATGVENTYFKPSYTAVSDAEAQQLYPGYPAAQAADGGLMGYAGGGPVEQMSNANAIGANTGFPQAYLHNDAYSTPYQAPISQNVLTDAGDVSVDPYTGEQRMATGGISDAHYNLGGYSDGGRLLRGPGDGVSDSIPAVIGKKQPARLADGEFVVPARIVSELGNGSTEAGARRLYSMMDRIQSARGKTVGKGKVAKNTRADKYLPA